jgi:hypothetical protein
VSDERFASTRWFHAIDLGAFATSRRFPAGEPQNVTLYGATDLIQHIDLRGAAVLDIGTADGLISFGAVALGPERAPDRRVDRMEHAVGEPVSTAERAGAIRV